MYVQRKRELSTDSCWHMLNLLPLGVNVKQPRSPPSCWKIQEHPSSGPVFEDLAWQVENNDGLFFFQDSGIVHADHSIRDSLIRQDLKDQAKGLKDGR